MIKIYIKMDWKKDKDLEKAMLESSLLFLKTKIKNNRADLLQKYVLSLLLSGRASDVETIKNVYELMHPDSIIEGEFYKLKNC